MANTPEQKKEILNIRFGQVRPGMDKIADTWQEDAVPAAGDVLGDTAAFSEEESSDSEAGLDAQESAEAAGGEENQHSLPRRIVDRILYSLGGVIPKRGDPVLEIVRKCVFFVALITLITSLCYIIDDMVIIPVRNQISYNQIGEEYDPDNPASAPADFPESEYPAGILDAFKALYAQNQDIRGWLKYNDSNSSWLNINYPVMFSGDNSYYLTHDFQKAKNKNGALFFDQRTNLESAKGTNKALIIYGHNMASGQMFAPLNKFLDNVNYIRSAPTISLDTLYARGKYEVFAVMLLNVDTKDGPYFDYLRTSFSSDSDFMNFVANVRARSIYDINDVDVTSSDQLLILSTCTAESGAHFEDGRCVVVARRVRDGESFNSNSSSIVKNADVIYPLAWYKNQKLTVHKFYTDPNYVIPGLQTPISGTSTQASPGTVAAGNTTVGTIVSGTTVKTGASGKTTATTKAASPTTKPGTTTTGKAGGTTQKSAATTEAAAETTEAASQTTEASATEQTSEPSQTAGE